MFKINKNMPVPIYYQLKESIKEKIEKGDLKPGDRIPTEQELCEMFGISRTPVRQALTELAYEGILYRRPGRGTFVSEHLLSSLGKNVRTIRAMVPEEKWALPIEAAVAMWNEKNPGRMVKHEILVTGHSQLRFKIATAVAAGKAPDFSLVDSVWVAEFAKASFLIPLEEIDPDWVEDDYKRDFSPVFVEGDSYEGKPYAIHAQTDVALLWYRKDWFGAEGISPPTTWEELIQAARHFQQDHTRRRYAMGDHAMAFPASLKAGETTSYLLLPFLWSAGGDVFADGRVVLNSEAVCRAVRLLRDLVHKYKVASPGVASCEWDWPMKLFAAGKVAVSVGGSYESGMIKELAGWDEQTFRERVGFVPIPAGPAGKQTTTAGGMTYAIYRQSKHPDLALEILKIVTGPKLMKDFCVTTGHHPPRISVAESLDPEGNWFLVETQKMLSNAKVRPITPHYPKVSEQLRAMIENAVARRMRVEQAVQKAAEIISAITGLPQG
ncbi:MAG TPA: extracellular solute-binding protein [Anaerolineae bacterium]|nr:extracellular solute-binding protein [Anaerolineae bacterium]